ncbi:MAG: MaoC/PaaZ C-terminal domain-containing protein [Casimicrobiaceae bacterium]
MAYQPMRFEDYALEMEFSAGPRTISRQDIADFARLSGDHTALHSDEAYASTTPFGRVVAHGALNLAVATGLAYATGIFEGTVLAVRSMDVAFDRPVFPGDQLTLDMTVRELEGQPRPGRGQVAFRVRLRNQDSRVVLQGIWRLVVRRSNAG